MAKKLTDEQKLKLIKSYEDNSFLWDSGNPYHKNKEKRDLCKNQLKDVFNGEFEVYSLEQAFHSL